jgi:hypothetical protein
MGTHTLHRGGRRYSLNDYSTGTSLIPTDINGLVYWFKGNDISGSQGTHISNWPAAYGTTILTQSTALAQPQLDFTYFGGLPSVKFDGSQQYFNFGSAVGAGNTFTMMFFINQPTTASLQLYASTTNNYQVRIGNNMWTFDNSNSTFSTNNLNSPMTSSSKMITAVKPSTTTINWYDGITSIGGGACNSMNWILLCHPFGVDTQTWFNGAIAEVLLWNTTLTDSQILNLHDNYFKIKYASDSTFI